MALMSHAPKSSNASGTAAAQRVADNVVGRGSSHNSVGLDADEAMALLTERRDMLVEIHQLKASLEEEREKKEKQRGRAVKRSLSSSKQAGKGTKSTKGKKKINRTKRGGDKENKHRQAKLLSDAQSQARAAETEADRLRDVEERTRSELDQLQRRHADYREAHVAWEAIQLEHGARFYWSPSTSQSTWVRFERKIC